MKTFDISTVFPFYVADRNKGMEWTYYIFVISFDLPIKKGKPHRIYLICRW